MIAESSGSLAEWVMAAVALVGAPAGTFVAIKVGLARAEERHKALMSLVALHKETLSQGIAENRSAIDKADASASRAHDRITDHVERYHMRRTDT